MGYRRAWLWPRRHRSGDESVPVGRGHAAITTAARSKVNSVPAQASCFARVLVHVSRTVKQAPPIGASRGTSQAASVLVPSRAGALGRAARDCARVSDQSGGDSIGVRQLCASCAPVGASLERFQAGSGRKLTYASRPMNACTRRTFGMNSAMPPTRIELVHAV